MEIKNLKIAIQHVDGALSIFPESKFILDTRVQLNLLIGNTQEAITDFNRAIEAGGDYPGTYFSRGVAFEKIGRYAEALEDYRHSDSIFDSRREDDFLSLIRPQTIAGIRRLSAELEPESTARSKLESLR